jgi:hypothetical protein
MQTAKHPGEILFEVPPLHRATQAQDSTGSQCLRSGLWYRPHLRRHTSKHELELKNKKPRNTCTQTTTLTMQRLWDATYWMFLLDNYANDISKVQALRVRGGWGSQISRQSAHEGGKVVSPTHRSPLPPGNISGTHFCWRLSRPQGHSATGRIMLMKNSNDTIGNRTRNLVAQCLNQLRHRVPSINRNRLH